MTITSLPSSSVKRIRYSVLFSITTEMKDTNNLHIPHFSGISWMQDDIGTQYEFRLMSKIRCVTFYSCYFNSKRPAVSNDGVWPTCTLHSSTHSYSLRAQFKCSQSLSATGKKDCFVSQLLVSMEISLLKWKIGSI